MHRILFVCTGNICRSPTAEVVFRAKAQAAGLGERVFVDSAGTASYHVGEPADGRSAEAARRRGYRFEGQIARQVRANDFETFDLILALDAGHLAALRRLCPPARRDRLALLMDHASPPWAGSDVPDPYYGGAGGFDDVLDRIEDACDGLVERLKAVPLVSEKS
ncbi:phosphotyrosine protein phosphatase [Rhodospirillum rubrum]|uniref:low molecular weight protein-tyrosine-phosphatase n=1 Tax=Rhodospirillum rubrum TaxID=1085 RepID=UPI00190902E1|nr:low molecular weight protein-tyrosine-phosphatase [Rhodospirillum rubrum]MBK1663251.1 phosphotyrosine protein phosphatase [Rhodospirillum rubrum]MBK1676188.1 phosphotyrosine protein phosphatase [Rhodospirillum rubrum]